MTGEPVVSAVRPQWAVPGGRLLIEGAHLPLEKHGPPRVTIGGVRAPVMAASSRRLRVQVPAGVDGGLAAIRIEPGGIEAGAVQVAQRLATGLHQVDNPAFDGLGRLYATHSGGRGVKVPVPIFRIGRTGAREPLAVDLSNPTGFALGPDGMMYVSSRFDGQVHRLTTDDTVDLYAAELGVPTGLAFGRDGTLFVGDRSGQIFRISPDRRVDTFATLPASVAAFHLAFGPDECLYVSAPTLASHDPIYRITPDRLVETLLDEFGRPQGLAFDSSGDLYVVEALAGAAGVARVNIAEPTPRPVPLLSAPMLTGIAFDPAGGVVLASSDTLWRLDVPVSPLPRPFTGA
jgi:DNA-binding beta-propeller fold protein YncE